MKRTLLALALCASTSTALAQLQDLSTWTANGNVSFQPNLISLNTLSSYATGMVGGTVGSALTGQVMLAAGDLIQVDWRFTSKDRPPYNDFALFLFNDMLLQLADAASLGGGADHQPVSTGWQHLVYQVPVSGVATLGFLVSNVGDRLFQSQLDLAQVSVSPIPEPTPYLLLGVGLLGLLLHKTARKA